MFLLVTAYLCHIAIHIASGVLLHITCELLLWVAGAEGARRAFLKYNFQRRSQTRFDALIEMSSDSHPDAISCCCRCRRTHLMIIDFELVLS